MPLVWVTDNSGTGKSAACALLKSEGRQAFDADWEGCNRWVDRADGNAVTDPPYPVPAGWLDRFAWKIDRAQVEALAARTHGETAFLCGNDGEETAYRTLGATIIDGSQPVADIAAAILAAAAERIISAPDR